MSDSFAATTESDENYESDNSVSDDDISEDERLETDITCTLISKQRNGYASLL